MSAAIATDTPSAAPASQRKVQPLSRNRIQSGDFVRKIHAATAHENTEPEDLLRPEYWAMTADGLRDGDRIEVRADDNTWLAELFVIGATRNSADVRLLHVHTFEAPENPGEPGDKSYFVKYRGPHSKWSVIRTADNAIVHEGDSSKTAANDWLTQHMKALNH